MPANQQDKPSPAVEKQERQQRNALIGKRVMHALGQPEELRAVDVRLLWEDHYRVNVFVGPDLASLRVAHSFFLVTDGAGNITVSTPKITKQY